MVKKLRRGVLVGKRGGVPCTPPPRWRLEFSAELKDNNNNNNNNNYKAFAEFVTTPTVSARKLCASLWDFESHHSPLSKTSKSGTRIRSRRQLKNNGFKLPKHLPHLSNVNPKDDEEEVEEEVSLKFWSLLFCQVLLDEFVGYFFPPFLGMIVFLLLLDYCCCFVALLVSYPQFLC